MLRYRMLAVDIDGTLVNSRDELTPATRAALARARAAGIRVAVATGRRYSRTLEVVEPLALDVPVVTSSGALVKDPLSHRTLYCAEFAPGTLPTVLTVSQECGFDSLLCADTFTDGFDYYCAHRAAQDVSTPELVEFLTLNPGCGRHCPELMRSPPAGVFMAIMMGTHAQMLALDDRLHAALPGRLMTHVLRSPRYKGYICEVAPAGVTKWSAIHRLATAWGIGDEAICAVGDDVNDVPMIRAAGLGAAMGNALDVVKAAADLVVPTHDEDGLAWLVERLLDEAA